jgi:hypothetical protein
MRPGTLQQWRTSMSNETPGEIACRAWTEHHIARHACSITPWDDLKEADRADWEAAAEAVIMGVDI